MQDVELENFDDHVSLSGKGSQSVEREEQKRAPQGGRCGDGGAPGAQLLQSSSWDSVAHNFFPSRELPALFLVPREVNSEMRLEVQCIG